MTPEGFGYDPERGELWFAGETAEAMLLELQARRRALAGEFDEFIVARDQFLQRRFFRAANDGNQHAVFGFDGVKMQFLKNAPRHGANDAAVVHDQAMGHGNIFLLLDRGNGSRSGILLGGSMTGIDKMRAGGRGDGDDFGFLETELVRGRNAVDATLREATDAIAAYLASAR